MTIRKLQSIFSKKTSKDITSDTVEALARNKPLTFSAELPTPPEHPTFHQIENSLAGSLLVATHLVNGSCFHKSVIYLFAHNEEGAMGCIINQPVESVHYSSLIDETTGTEETSAAQEEELTVYFGGPVERARGFVLHTPDYKPEETLVSHPTVAITAVSGILQDIVTGTGPERSALMVGYAGWSAGQLEQELENNSWINVPATRELVFETADEHKWSLATQSLGFDMSAYSHSVGHA